MAHIKTALELALERTEGVKSDKNSIKQHDLKRDGKRIAGLFLENPEGKSLEGELKKYPKDDQATVRRGIFDILVAQVSLPNVKEDLKRIETVGKGLQAILGDKRFGQLYAQLTQMLNQFLSELEQYDEAIRRQFAPKLRQKEEELARRMGRAVKIDPFQDPEFVGFYNQNMNALKDRYQTIIDQVRAQASAMIEEVK